MPSTPPDEASRHPLVILSEHGGRTEASRRIVRAQAARASAAQSRMTRARNREGREGTAGDHVQSLPITEPVQTAPFYSGSPSRDQSAAIGQKPLAVWLSSTLGVTAGSLTVPSLQLGQSRFSLLEGPSTLASSTGPSDTDRSPSTEGIPSPGKGGKLQLPMALPRGFASLQQRLYISDPMIELLSRTACIDFASPGVEGRLNQLLFDLIVKAAGLGISLRSGHPIQGHLRIACTCLTIFQGQRANGAAFAHDRKYNIGLEAAWSEALLLDQTALAEPKSAEASLWAVFIISVTAGASADFFHLQLHALLQDLRLHYWEQVRRVLLDFIYPSVFLDEPCRLFFNHLRVAYGTLI